MIVVFVLAPWIVAILALCAYALSGQRGYKVAAVGGILLGMVSLILAAMKG